MTAASNTWPKRRKNETDEELRERHCKHLTDIVNDIDFEKESRKLLGKNKELAMAITSVKPKSNKPIFINKYSGNGRLSLHESIIIATTPKFVTVPQNYIGNGDVTPKFLSTLDAGTGITYFPNGTIDTTTPLPYVFSSQEEFTKYLKLAISESYDSLYIKVDLIYRKFVNVEEYYYPILTGDTIWSYFQDRFGYTHYLLFTGDNGSGKNSALLVFRYLAYRVFYVVSANAPNYFTAYGNQEEGQVTIAEDEADDIGDDRDKRDLLKAGYQSGGSVPKIELDGGRSQDNWLVYGLKWLAMEELKVDRNTKGILHRSLQMGFLAGDVPYNIKDVIRSGDDPEYKPLFDELIHARKLLFCFRLLHHNDPIPMIRLNVKGRTAELTSPLIRLFQNSPLAREKILDSLSKFMIERKQTILNSFESKLCDSIQTLIDLRAVRIKNEEQTEEDKELGPYTFTNESIKQRLIDDTEAQPDPEKKNMYYSAEIGAFSQTKITTVLKSKFKPKFPNPKKINGKTCRIVQFNQDYLSRLKASSHVPDKIEIVEKDPVTAVTPVTPSGRTSSFIDKDLEGLGSKNEHDDSNSKSQKDVLNGNERVSIPPDGVTAVTGVTNVTPVTVTCPKCGKEIPDDFYAKTHLSQCDGSSL